MSVGVDIEKNSVQREYSESRLLTPVTMLHDTSYSVFRGLQYNPKSMITEKHPDVLQILLRLCTYIIMYVYIDYVHLYGHIDVPVSI